MQKEHRSAEHSVDGGEGAVESHVLDKFDKVLIVSFVNFQGLIRDKGSMAPAIWIKRDVIKLFRSIFAFINN